MPVIGHDVPMRRVSARVMVGRDADMSLLLDASRRAAAGQPTIVLVQGEAGVGKSRLAAEWATARRSEGWLVVTGRCAEMSGTELPLAAVVDAVRDLERQVGASQVQRLAGRWWRALATLVADADVDQRSQQELDDADPEPVDRASLFDAVASLLGSAADEAPLGLVIEDVHWADSSTRDLLSYLSRVMTTQRLMLVLTHRDETSTPPAIETFIAELLRLPSVEQVTLRPLAADDVAAQMQDISGHRPSAAHLARVVELSDGLPFLVEELVASAGTEDDDPSDRVRRIVMSRLAGLSSHTRRVVDAASLADAELTDALLRQALVDADLEVDVDEALHEAVSAAVLVPNAEGYRFRHALVRLAVAESMLPGERRRWHARWAAALEKNPRTLDPLTTAVTTAQHWDAAGDAEHALPAALAAAELCGRRGSYAERSVLLAMALSAWDLVPEAEEVAGLPRNRLVDETYGALSVAANWPAAEAMFEAELQRPGIDTDPLRQVLLRLNLAATRAWLDRPQPVPDLDEIIELVEAAPPSRDKVQALQELCWRVTWTDLEQGRRFIEQAVRAGEALPDEPQLLLSAQVDQADQMYIAGRYTEAREAHTELRHRLSEMDPNRAGIVQQFMILGSYSLGDLEGARLEAESALARLGNAAAAPWSWSGVSGVLAETLFALGRWDETVRLVEENRSFPFLRNDPTSRVYLDCLRGLIAALRGDVALAQRLTERYEPSDEATFGSSWVELLRLRAEVAAAAGDFRRVRDTLDTAWARPDLGAHTDEVRPSLVLAARAEAELTLAARARHDNVGLQESADVVERLRALVTSLPAGSPVDRAYTLQMDAELSRRDAQPNVEAWTAAESAWRPMGFPYDRACALHRLGESLLIRDEPGDRDQAAQVLSEARALTDVLSARPLAEEIAGLARRGRVTLADLDTDERPAVDEQLGTSPVADHLGLTDREVEVLALVIEGYSNADIARELFMARKTASVHVSRILTKLGASNRTQAATIGQRLGLGR